MGRCSAASSTCSSDPQFPHIRLTSWQPVRSIARFVRRPLILLRPSMSSMSKLPQALTGFFHSSTTEGHFLESPVAFTGLPGSQPWPPMDTSFAFLPSQRRLDLLDSCNGLLLFRWYGVSTQGDEFRYVVCNPATEKWTVLPDCSGQADKPSTLGTARTARLGFDPAVSPHFHVFELEEEDQGPKRSFLAEISQVSFKVYSSETGVSVYSSETGGWVHKEKRPGQFVLLTRFRSAAVFLNGNLLFHAFDHNLSTCLAAVDTEAETWTNFGVPDGLLDGFVQCSQGRLHYANFQGGEDGTACRLVVYVLEDYDSKEWILKHSVEKSYIFNGMSVCLDDLDWVAIHPEHNLIFFTLASINCSTVMSYDMDSRQLKVICNLEDGRPPYLPYVPLYAELPSLHVSSL